jgi:hypothetical protein
MDSDKTDKSDKSDKIIGLDKFLSIWVIVYSWGYIIGIFNYNPIVLSFIIASYVFFATIIILCYYNKNTNLLYYLVTNLSVKLPPLYWIYYIIKKELRVIDIIFTCLFVLSYVIYMKLVDENIFNVYRDYIASIIDENNGRSEPLFPVYQYYRNYRNYRNKYIKNK